MKTGRAWRICGWCALQGARLCLWSVWLLLLLALAGQIHLLSARRVPVPEPLRRFVENRLAAQGLRLEYGRGHMDFAGRVALENITLTPASDPGLVFATAHAAYVRFDPWQLLLGRLELRESRVDGLELPGLAENIDLSFSLRGNRLDLSYLSGRAGPASLHAAGTLRIAGVAPAARDTPPGERLAAAWPGLLARARAADPWLAALEKPSLHLSLLDRGIDVEIEAASADLSARAPGAGLGPLRARATLALSGAVPLLPVIEGSVAALSAPGLSAEDLRFRLDTTEGLATATLDLQLGAARWRGLSAGPAVVSASQPAPGEFAADVSAGLAGGAWAVSARAEPSAGAARLALRGVVDDDTLAFAGGLVGRDLAALLDPEQAALLDVRAEFAGGWRLSRAAGRLHSGRVRVGRVMLDETAAEFDYDGARVLCSPLVLRQHESLARGSYEMDTRTMDFRFLLAGGLRPAGISGWFHDWWSGFWDDFDFTLAVPSAEVDIQGRWGDTDLTRVFVRAEGDRVGLKTVPFDRVSTRLFLRPGWFDILRFDVARAEGSAGGSFLRAGTADGHAWTRMEFDVASTLPLPVIHQLFPGESAEILAPYRFDTPPALAISGHVTSADSPGGKSEHIDVGIRSSGAMTFHGFPLADLRARVFVRDDHIDLPDLAVTFAEGRAAGSAALSGEPPQRRLSFDIRLDDADLARVAEAVDRLNPSAGPPSAKAAEAARQRLQRLEGGRLDFALKAEGPFTDFHAFRGEGRGAIDGAELGQLNLFGPLSAALSGTFLNLGSFSLSHVEAPFRLAGDRLRFDDLRVSGPSALIIAKGDYRLRDGSLDFTARIHPFDESPSLLGSAASFVLTPLSKVFEVRLAGTLSDPSWIFSYGPSRLLNSLTGGNQSAPARSPADASPAGKP